MMMMMMKTLSLEETLEGAVASWSNEAGFWCQKLSKVGVQALATVASQSCQGFD